MIGKVSILGDMAHADEAFGPFLSPVHIAPLQLRLTRKQAVGHRWP